MGFPESAVALTVSERPSPWVGHYSRLFGDQRRGGGTGDVELRDLYGAQSGQVTTSFVQNTSLSLPCTPGWRSVWLSIMG
jgi:hypothetical protein